MIVGRLKDSMKYFHSIPVFKDIIEYLNEALLTGSEVNRRIFDSKVGAFRKEPVVKDVFALEQVFLTKDRSECFFESHKLFVDFQLVLEGQELMEYSNTSGLIVKNQYDERKDLIIYESSDDTSKILLKKGDIAIFFPEDAHMGLPKHNDVSKVFKTVIKVPVAYFDEI